MLGEKIDGNKTIDELLAVLSNAKEFAGLPVRHNEDILNEALTHLVPIKVPKHELESPHVKANLLLQAHFERCPLPITDFITDTKSVLDQSIRVLQGMIDVASHKSLLA
jgi:activating signal cointegrator complex subunit 3